MISRIQNKLGTAGLVVAIVALVAALGGAAFAAISPQEKKEIKKWAKKYAKQFAKEGPTGPAGLQGVPGAEGKIGPEGPEGKPGEDGKDGIDGMCSEAQPECLAPSEATLTGVWSQFFNATPQQEVLSISYPLQVVPAPSIEVVVGAFENGPGASFNPATGEELALLESAEEVEALCPGSASAPSAEPGVICIYSDTVKTAEFNVFGLVVDETLGASPDPTSGALVPVVSLAANGYINGSWAVTAE